MNKFNLSAVKTQVVLSSEGDKSIFFGVDNQFIAHALITLMSVTENADYSGYQFHIISSDLKDNDIDMFIEVLAGTNYGLTLHHVDKNIFDSLPTAALFTQATYYRLLAPLLVPDTDRFLYLDADMVCINSLEALWSIPMSEQDIVLVVGENDELQPKLAANVGLQNKRYFNSGMMLINVAKWNRENISEKVFTLLSTTGKRFQYFDQDALNIVLEGSARYIDRRFNYIEKLAHDENGYNIDVPPDTCIIHYAGADKPWQEWNQQKVCQYYRNIYSRSPIADSRFYLPKDNQQAKKMYKTMFRTHQLLRGIYWRIRYYQMRYF